MKLLKTLQNPFALIFQGFVVGGFLFFAAHPFAGGETPQPEPTGGSVISTLDA